MKDKDIISLKNEIKESFKDHIITVEVETDKIKSYLYKKPKDGIYWCRIVETPGGVMMEGDCGTLKVNYKNLNWVAGATSTGYAMSKLDYECHKADSVDDDIEDEIISRMKEHIIEYDEREEFNEEENWFISSISSSWSIEKWYEGFQDLDDKVWYAFYEDGLHIEDYSHQTYFKWLVLHHFANKLLEIK